VRAGEKGLRIVGPVTRRLRADEVAAWIGAGRDPFDADGRPRLVVRGFTVEHVFDLSQVDPGPDAHPLPETRTWTVQRGDGPDGLWPALVALTETHPWRRRRDLIAATDVGSPVPRSPTAAAVRRQYSLPSAPGKHLLLVLLPVVDRLAGYD
jgi:hypothetical protein